MLLVGVLMYVLQKKFGHYYVEGVGYATVQAILLGQLTAAGAAKLVSVRTNPQDNPTRVKMTCRFLPMPPSLRMPPRIVAFLIL